MKSPIILKSLMLASGWLIKNFMYVTTEHKWNVTDPQMGAKNAMAKGSQWILQL